jgi:hypothetical protein
LEKLSAFPHSHKIFYFYKNKYLKYKKNRSALLKLKSAKKGALLNFK